MNHDGHHMRNNTFLTSIIFHITFVQIKEQSKGQNFEEQSQARQLKWRNITFPTIMSVSEEQMQIKDMERLEAFKQ